MDPEVELSNRESAYWCSEVEGVLQNITLAFHWFRHRKVSGNDTNRELNRLADQLAGLDWLGWEIPF